MDQHVILPQTMLQNKTKQPRSLGPSQRFTLFVGCRRAGRRIFGRTAAADARRNSACRRGGRACPRCLLWVWHEVCLGAASGRRCGIGNGTAPTGGAAGPAMTGPRPLGGLVEDMGNDTNASRLTKGK